MGQLAWNEAFSVGNAMLDSDHRILMNLVNQLQDAVETGQSRAVVGTVIDVLVEYTEHHFRREEAMMAAAGYPDLAAHQGAHRALEEKVRAVRDRWNTSPRSTLDDQVMSFLKRWLTEHILGADKSYGPWIEGGSGSVDPAGKPPR